MTDDVQGRDGHWRAARHPTSDAVWGASDDLRRAGVHPMGDGVQGASDER
jgi:hypothetical protein